MPDFVKDYFSDQPIERINQPDLALPDFTLPSEPGRSGSFRSDQDKNSSFSEISQPNVSERPFNHLPLSTDVNEAAIESDDDEQVLLPDDQTKRYSTLPDFLSGALSDSSSSLPLTRSPPDGIANQFVGNRDGVISFEVNGDLELEVRRVGN